MTREIKYLPLRSLVSNPDNPKDHDIGMIVESIERFGFNDAVIVDGRTGMLVGGHGRVEALEWMYQDHLKNNRKCPEGILAQEQSMGPDGDWLVPVQTGWSSKDDAEAMAFIIAVNRAPELGGWNTPKLEEVLLTLGKMGAENLVGTGYDNDDILRLLNSHETKPNEDYTSRILGPVYTPKGHKPTISSLLDSTKTDALNAEISETEGLSSEEKSFLVQASKRHLRFDYQAIAEFYAHASIPMQRAMEASALVVIDFNQAMERGFVELTEGLLEEFSIENGS